MAAQSKLTLSRLIALASIIPSLALVVLGLVIGTQHGGIFWLLSLVLFALSGLMIWKSVEYYKRPSRAASADILTLFSLGVYGAVSSWLRSAYPDASGIPSRLGIGSENTEGVIMLGALVVAWTIHRILKKLFVDSKIQQ
jgi:hypothetical protein